MSADELLRLGQAVEAERRACAEAVCRLCAESADRYYHRDGFWFHDLPFRGGPLPVPCFATPIWERQRRLHQAKPV